MVLVVVVVVVVVVIVVDMLGVGAGSHVVLVVSFSTRLLVMLRSDRHHQQRPPLVHAA